MCHRRGLLRQATPTAPCCGRRSSSHHDNSTLSITATELRVNTRKQRNGEFNVTLVEITSSDNEEEICPKSADLSTWNKEGTGERREGAKCLEAAVRGAKQQMIKVTKLPASVLVSALEGQGQVKPGACP